MNHIAACRNVETTVKTLAADSAISAERALKQTLESINNCIDLRQQQQDNLASWLKQQSSGASTGGQ